jgi:archaellin
MMKQIRNQKAMSGISTLIIFIALILVAAIAALVLLQTVGTLQSQAIATGTESRKQVSGQLQIITVTGIRTGINPNQNQNINYLRILTKLSPGGQKIGLARTTINYTDGINNKTGISYNAICANNVELDCKAALDAVTDADVTYTTSNYSVLFLGSGAGYFGESIDTGQLVEIWYNAPDLATNQDVTLTIYPDKGSVSQLSFKTPTSYDANYVTLYP